MNPIAHIETCFPTKFGIPRQAGIADVPGRIVFEPQYRVAEAVRGLDGFDYIWLIWEFSKTVRTNWSPTVRPPRLGGNERMGVFSTRSPFRPNPIGLSSVRLLRVEQDKHLGPILHVVGADLMDGTPIYDIKPYLPYADSHPNARSGFASCPTEKTMEVRCPAPLLQLIPSELQQPLLDILANDPRPAYHQEKEVHTECQSNTSCNRIYGMPFDRFDIRFYADEGTIYVVSIIPLNSEKEI